MAKRGRRPAAGSRRRTSAGAGRRRGLPWNGLKRQLRRTVIGTVAAALLSLLAVNGAVAILGESVVNPVSPWFMEAKLQALLRYGRHRVSCLGQGGHVDLPDHVVAAAARRGVDRYLLMALVEVESSGRAHRISAAGAMGPAQLMPSTADLLRVSDPFDPADGIDGGARYLRQMLDRFKGNPALALAAYTAGPGAVVNNQVPRNPEVVEYVSRVMTRWKELRPVAHPERARAVSSRP